VTRENHVLTDLRTPPRPSARIRAIALHHEASELDASVWPMVTFVGAVLLSLALLAIVAG
jgi:hypothetical protein